MKKFLNRLRYNAAFSRLLTLMVSPFYAVAKRFVKRVQSSVKVNGVSVSYDGVQLQFPKNVGVGFSSSIYWKGVEGFEPHTWRVIRALGTVSDVFVDIGSNFGFYSVLLEKLQPEIKSYCFEPVPEIFKSNEAFHQSNATRNAEILNLAVSDQPGKAVLFLPAGQPVAEIRSGSLNKDFFYNQQFSQVEISIEKVTLDAWIGSRGIDWKGKKILMKIDVEGHELPALRGAAQVINSFKPLIVCEIEQIQDNVLSIQKLLNEWRYVAFAISAVGLIRANDADMLAFRNGRDFLLIPEGFVTGGRSYYSFTELQDLSNG